MGGERLRREERELYLQRRRRREFVSQVGPFFDVVDSFDFKMEFASGSGGPIC